MAAAFSASVMFGSLRIISIFPSMNERVRARSASVSGVVRRKASRMSAIGALEGFPGGSPGPGGSGGSSIGTLILPFLTGASTVNHDGVVWIEEHQSEPHVVSANI
jgi:hypothetical protein